MLEQKPIHRLEVRDLSFWYEPETPVFKQLSVEIPVHKVVHLKGDSGSGKSSFLRLLAGLSDPSQGSYFVNDDDVAQMSFEEFIPYRLNIGYSFDFGGLLSNLTVWKNLALPLQYHGIYSAEQVKQRVEEMLGLFDLESSTRLRPSAISGSSRKAAIVARSLVMNPQLLLMDDPTTGLSQSVRVTLKKYLKAKREQGYFSTVVVVSEDKQFTEGFVDEELTLDNLKMLDHKAVSLTSESNTEAA